MRSILSIAIILITSVSLQSGTKYSLSCNNEKCRYKTSLMIGGGFSFDREIGYCPKCKDFQAYQWAARRGGKGVPPKVLLKFWNPGSGLMRSIYPCPNCTTPFLALVSGTEIKICPKCELRKVTIKEEYIYD